MDLTFGNFKQELPAKILERGQAYVQAGTVNDLDMIDDGRWSAQVLGTDIYDVDIEQLANGTLACTCTCPYEHGEYCKHVAAVLYAIEETFPDQVKPRKRKTTAANRESPKEKLRDVLQKAPQPDLVAALLDLAKQDKRIANQLMMRFGAVRPDKANYGKLIKDTLRGHMDRGYLDYQGARRAGHEVLGLVAQSDQLLEQGQWDSAVAYFRAVIDNVVAVINQADDSDGTLGEAVAESILGLERAATQGTEDQDIALFTYCLQDAQADMLSGWDWRWDLFRLAADLVSMPEQRQQLFTVLDKYQPASKTDRTSPFPNLGITSHFISNFDAERAASIMLSVIERLDGQQAVERFISDHLHLDRFRQMMIDRLMQRGELQKAKQIVAEAITATKRQN